MHAWLIVGGTDKKRLEKARETLQSVGVLGKNIHTIVPIENSHTIASVRKLVRFLSVSSGSEKRGIIIPNAEKMTTEATNAFLKTLEEPPSQTFFVLTAPNPSSLPATVVSRCFIKTIGQPRLKITEQERKKTEQLFQELFTMDLGRRLSLGERMKNRQEALDFVYKQIYVGRQFLIKRALSELPIQEIVNTLERLEEARESLEANANVDMVIGELLMHWKRQGDGESGP